jgi:hypothetical protein
MSPRVLSRREAARVWQAAASESAWAGLEQPPPRSIACAPKERAFWASQDSDEAEAFVVGLILATGWQALRSLQAGGRS